MAEKVVSLDKEKKSRSKAKGVNGIPPKEMRECFARLHELLDGMEEENAATRGKIGRIYDAFSDKHAVTKSAIMLVFKRERRNMKDEAKAAKMDRDERDSLQKLAQSLGEGPLSDWVSQFVSKIPDAKPEDAAEE